MSPAERLALCRQQFIDDLGPPKKEWADVHHAFVRRLDELLECAIPQAAEVPGFVLVPREPTKAMLPEAWRIANGKVGLGVDHECLRAIYRSMLAAAPTPTASAAKAEGEAAQTVPWPTVGSYSGGAASGGTASWLKVRLGDGPETTEFVRKDLAQPPSEADRTREGVAK